ncbi:MAG TPA: radical SAM protein [Alphaproteobacteria bacterium]|nr:radical SAM protein [Alphaproteobacteria bacterium]
MNAVALAELKSLDPRKFCDPIWTAKGDRRASVALTGLKTLWFNTGTLCNLTCTNCYIESSPTNDRLSYLSAAEVREYLDEIARERLPTEEIGFTGGEPFMNRELPQMLEECMSRGFRALVLTNAMRPMMKLAEKLLALNARYGARLAVRVSVDHYTKDLHQLERGPRSWLPMLQGLRWLARHGFNVHVAGRTFSGQPEAEIRRGYAQLFAEEGIDIDANDAVRLVLFPEMDAKVDVPEITEACWGILKLSPDAMMCASSRMVVKRKGETRPAVVACTLLPYDQQFELGATLAEASVDVKLNHPHCAKFCVLGGGSCSKG